MINKVSQTFNYIYLTLLMLLVVALLLLNFLKEGVVALFKEKKEIAHVKNSTPQKSHKSTKYIITNSQTTNS
jgi:hypothetical protein